MTSVGDVLRFTACGKLFDQEICNVFYWTVAVWTGNATLEDAVEELLVSWATVASALQDQAFSWENANLDNVTTEVEGAEFTFVAPVPGVFASGSMPSFAAMSFRQNRATKLTRNGYKRLAGVPEGLVEDNQLAATVAGSPEGLALRGFLGQDFVDPEYVFTPVIAGRTATGGIDFSRINGIDGVTLQSNLTTQNTRKPGRGV